MSKYLLKKKKSGISSFQSILHLLSGTFSLGSQTFIWILAHLSTVKLLSISKLPFSSLSIGLIMLILQGCCEESGFRKNLGTSYLTSLFLNFFICKIEIMIITDHRRIIGEIVVNCLVLCLPNKKLSVLAQFTACWGRKVEGLPSSSAQVHAP